jgi:hypothetical protein
MSAPVVFLAIPSHDQRIHYSVATAIIQASSKFNLWRQFGCTSLLAHNFNQLYASALNLREKHKLKWFVMLHSDVAPLEANWLDRLINTAEKLDADLLSVVMPFKDDSGISSTAVSDPYNPWTPYARLTMQQLATLPEHFDFKTVYDHFTGECIKEHLRMPGMSPDAQLLVNSGCMALRIDRDWSWRAAFNINDEIIHHEGQYKAVVRSEDWNLSEQVANIGGRVYATRAIKAVHIGGNVKYHNNAVWGQHMDQLCPDFQPLKQKA